MSSRYQVLYVDDSPFDRELVREALEASGTDFELLEAGDREEFEALLAETRPDLVLTDFNILGYRGLDVLAHVQQVRPGTPVILVTGTGSEEVALQALQAGVSDYVIKTPNHIRRLPQTILAALERRRLTEGRETAERRLRETSRLLAAVFDSSPLAIISGDMDRRITLWSRAAEEIFGYKAEEILGRPLPILPKRSAVEADRIRALVAEGHVVQGRIGVLSRKDGSDVTVEISAGPLRDDAGQVTGSMMVLADVTDKSKLEEQLRQAQRLEAVGRLAGGVAHDFNNVLVAILGYAELALRRPGLDPKTRRDLEEIHRAGERAATLTRQLLLMSRKQVAEPRIMALGTVVQGLERMLRRLIGEDIEVTVTVPGEAWLIEADPGQIEQVVMNLAVNARDAMPRGGHLRIEVRNESVPVATPGGAPPGDHVLLEVQDHGTGMPPEVLERIFEPFFTTKEQGKGTGLGLSTVYGIVERAHGRIEVDSTPGVGTTFRVSFPRAVVPEAAATRSAAVSEARPGHESILLVEDDDVVRAIARIILESLGYRVSAASGGREALDLLPSIEPLDLVITDVVMPGMSGRELADELHRLRPTLPVLYMSGYTGDALAQHDLAGDELALIRKPFTRIDFAKRVRDVLDRAAGAPEPGAGG
jgi:two-component system cell cycle sensor histidine kinase/response regulator CckA